MVPSISKTKKALNEDIRLIQNPPEIKPDVEKELDKEIAFKTRLLEELKKDEPDWHLLKRDHPDWISHDSDMNDISQEIKNKLSLNSTPHKK